MDERAQAEIDHTLDMLRPLALALRQRGYDASLWVERREDGHLGLSSYFTAEIRVRVPQFGVPVESVRSAAVV